MADTELDLHGKTWRESQDEFITFYNAALDHCNGSGVTLTVIHGYGSTGEGGVLRQRLRCYLDRLSDHLEYTTGEDMDGNMGCTYIAPIEPIPNLEDELAADILKFCEAGKTRSKITGKFRRHGQPKVLNAIRALERQGRLVKRINRRGLAVYGAS